MAKKSATSKKKITGEHPLAIGSYCTAFDGAHQGRAKILACVDGDHEYEIRFDRDKAKVVGAKVLPEHAETR